MDISLRSSRNKPSSIYFILASINSKIGLNIISIIDPLFTGVILIFVQRNFITKLTFKNVELIILIFHLSFNLIKYQQVKDYTHNIAIDNN